MATDAPIIARPKRPPPLLICGKCLSRIEGGKKLKQALKAGLKQHAAARGAKRPKLVTTGCLGICPKRAVVTASAATLLRNEYVLIDDRKAAAAAIAMLIPDAAGQGADRRPHSDAPAATSPSHRT
jgi:predicted metal-binding protein